MSIYNCHTDGDEYRITKFTDGNPEGSYLTSFQECQCPAGSRDTCRHRQMLPEFIDRGLVNSHLFLNWDHPARPTCDFEGKANVVVPEGLHVEEDTDNIDWDTMAEERLGQRPLQPHSPTVTTAGFGPAGTGSIPVGVATPWRRL